MGFVDKRRQDGIHAAAVVITKEPLLDYVPVQRKSGPNGSTDDAPIVTQYEATAIEKLGLLKMDFLGLRNLAIIERTLEHIDAATASRSTSTTWRSTTPRSSRCCASATRSASSSSRATRCANSCVASRRRASTTSRRSTRSIDRDRSGERAQRLRRPQERSPGRAATTTRTSKRSSARPTGLMIYQEDIMRVATLIAGFSMTEADDLRKACSKKIREMIHAQRIEVRRRRRTRGLRPRTRRGDLQQDRAVRRLRLQQEPRLRLRPAGLPERLAEGELSRSSTWRRC